MQGIITKGTTLRGRTVNAGEVLEISDEDFRLLASTGDIKPFSAAAAADAAAAAVAERPFLGSSTLAPTGKKGK
jgi:hypothetical protein